jgi:crotonobetainyl-CoA:carnitine CoA-transferase CaiB-like acyl-CoA transferase
MVYAICAALYSREKTGRGQSIETNLYSSLLHLYTQELVTYLNGGGFPERSETGIPNPFLGAPYGPYETADGYIAIAMNAVDHIARLIGVEGYETMTGNNIMEDRDEIRRSFMPAFRTKTTAEWLEIMLAEDIWCSPIYTFADVETDPQVLHNEMIAGYQHPTVGPVRTLGQPVKFMGTPGAIRLPAPLLGQHSREILFEFGFGEDAIQALVDNGTVLAGEVNRA